MPKAILVVDDEEEYRVLLKRVLTGAGYAVRTAANGKEGLRSFAEAPPDLVLLDVMMPDMTGYEVCRKVRSGKVRPATPVLLCTVRSAVSSLAEGVGSGATDYVLKPFDPDDVLARVAAALGGDSR